MHEETPKPQIDLNALRDKVVAGEDPGYSGPDLSRKSREEIHAETHFVNHALHPGMEPGPSLDAIRRAAEEQEAPVRPPDNNQN